MSQEPETDSPSDLAPYAPLLQSLGLEEGVPFTRHWSAGVDFLQIIVDHCRQAQPRAILECGSGLTTLALARCCQSSAGGRVVSLEDGSAFADRTRDFIRQYSLQDYATVLHAPLQPVTVDGLDYQWYLRTAIPQGKIDMLVIDGPPAVEHSQARFPALPLLFDRLSDGCTIFLDDAARPGERAIVERWLADFPGLQHDFRATERGCSVLHKT